MQLQHVVFVLLFKKMFILTLATNILCIKVIQMMSIYIDKINVNRGIILKVIRINSMQNLTLFKNGKICANDF